MQVEFQYTADDYADAATLHALSLWVVSIAMVPVMLKLTQPSNTILSVYLVPC